MFVGLGCLPNASKLSGTTGDLDSKFYLVVNGLGFVVLMWVWGWVFNS